MHVLAGLNAGQRGWNEISNGGFDGNRGQAWCVQQFILAHPFQVAIGIRIRHHLSTRLVRLNDTHHLV